jgi:hypothetical protein
MNIVTYRALREELSKIAGLGQAALEVGGLGILGKPSLSTLRSPTASKKEKSHAKWELGGLGVLAAHPALEVGKHFLKRGSALDGLLQLFKEKRALAPSPGVAKMMNLHRISDAFRSASKGISPAAGAIQSGAKAMGRAKEYSSMMPSAQAIGRKFTPAKALEF